MTNLNVLSDWTTLNEDNQFCRNKCGVYIIRNKLNNKFYIGSSKSILKRIQEHRCRFKKNDGINKHIQNAYNKYGESNFEYNVLDICTPDDKYDREQVFLSELKPEYNLSLNVIANKNQTRSEEAKRKSSETQRQMVKDGLINARKAYIYDIAEFCLIRECESTKDARKLLKISTGSNLDEILFREKYIISFSKFESLYEMKNYVNKTYMVTRTNKYIITEASDGSLVYYKSAKDFCDKYKISTKKFYKSFKDTIKDNPIILNDGSKFYYSNDFIEDTTISKTPIYENIQENFSV